MNAKGFFIVLLSQTRTTQLGRTRFPLVLILGLVLITALPLLSACRISNVGLVGEAAKSEFMDGFSPTTKQRQKDMHSLEYAQLSVRWGDGREMMYLLAERDRATDLMKWVGSGGSTLYMSGPFVLAATGIRDAIVSTAVLRRGEISALVWPLNGPTFSGQKNEGLEKESSLLIRGTFPETELEQVTLNGKIVSRRQVFYQSLAFTGIVDEVTEELEVAETLQKLRRVYWIEPASRRLLRLRGDLSPSLRNILMEWTRVPAEGLPRPTTQGKATG